MDSVYINTIETTFLFELFLNYKFISEQRKAANWQILFFSCLCVSLLFEGLVEIKIETESRVHYIDMYSATTAYICRKSLWIMQNRLKKKFC